MRTTYHHRINTVRSAALFASLLQRSDDPSDPQVRDAVARAVRTLGTSGCVERVAQEFGDHPELAVPRMEWARLAVEAAFRGRRVERERLHASTAPVAPRGRMSPSPA